MSTPIFSELLPNIVTRFGRFLFLAPSSRTCDDPLTAMTANVSLDSLPVFAGIGKDRLGSAAESRAYAPCLRSDQIMNGLDSGSQGLRS